MKSFPILNSFVFFVFDKIPLPNLSKGTELQGDGAGLGTKILASVPGDLGTRDAPSRPEQPMCEHPSLTWRIQTILTVLSASYLYLQMDLESLKQRRQKMIDSDCYETPWWSANRVWQTEAVSIVRIGESRVILYSLVF